MRLLKAVAFLALGALLAAAAPADSPVGVEEPEGLYEGSTHGYTPQTLKGATVVDLAAFEKLLAESKPVLIDVGLADRKPDNLPPSTIWLPTHRSIPGAFWLPNAGAAPMDPAHEAALSKRIDELTGGDKAKTIVAFCHPECWGSWNAAKRLVEAGYTRVHWFPLGVEGWQDAHDTVAVKADPAWAKAAGDTAKKSDAER